MITLGGVQISDNMYLRGVTEHPQVAFQQERTVEGISKQIVVPTPGGRTLSLETQQLSGSIQGIWCQSVIDAVKELELTGGVYELDHHGAVYQVRIIDTSQFTPLFQFEPV